MKAWDESYLVGYDQTRARADEARAEYLSYAVGGDEELADRLWGQHLRDYHVPEGVGANGYVDGALSALSDIL